MLYVKSVRIGSYSGPYFPAFGLNIRIQSECGKIWTKITLNMDTFQAVMAPNVVIILFTNLVRSYYLFIYLFYFIYLLLFYLLYFTLTFNNFYKMQSQSTQPNKNIPKTQKQIQIWTQARFEAETKNRKVKNMVA